MMETVPVVRTGLDVNNLGNGQNDGDSAVSPASASLSKHLFSSSAGGSTSAFLAPSNTLFISSQSQSKEQELRQQSQNQSRMPHLFNVSERQTLMLSDRQISTLVDGLLPPVCAISDWKQLYSLKCHGASLESLMKHMEGVRPPILLFVKDSKDAIFGVFSHDSWQVKSSFFGSSRTVVFTLFPHFKVYPSTGQNSFYMLANSQYLAVGGGNNHALWLDDNLRRGTSGPCATFDSPQLASEATFRIHSLEAWSFIAPQ
jgi:hypothetical protein